MRVLIAEDDRRVAGLLKNRLKSDHISADVCYDGQEALDRFALASFNDLVKTVREAYVRYEFHAVYRAVYNFCVVDMSNFYLDIIKDRLYCEGKDSLLRRSAQTALYLILDTMTKIMAPVLCFTGDEIWQAMPHPEGVDGRNVVFNDMNQPFTAYALDEAAMAQWETIIQVRDVVNGALETARAENMFLADDVVQLRRAQLVRQRAVFFLRQSERLL